MTSVGRTGERKEKRYEKTRKDRKLNMLRTILTLPSPQDKVMLMPLGVSVHTVHYELLVTLRAVESMQCGYCELRCLVSIKYPLGFKA